MYKLAGRITITLPTTDHGTLPLTTWRCMHGAHPSQLCACRAGHHASTHPARLASRAPHTTCLPHGHMQTTQTGRAPETQTARPDRRVVYAFARGTEGHRMAHGHQTSNPAGKGQARPAARTKGERTPSTCRGERREWFQASAFSADSSYGAPRPRVLLPRPTDHWRREQQSCRPLRRRGGILFLPDWTMVGKRFPWNGVLFRVLFPSSSRMFESRRGNKREATMHNAVSADAWEAGWEELQGYGSLFLLTATAAMQAGVQEWFNGILIGAGVIQECYQYYVIVRTTSTKPVDVP